MIKNGTIPPPPGQSLPTSNDMIQTQTNTKNEKSTSDIIQDVLNEDDDDTKSVSHAQSEETPKAAAAAAAPAPPAPKTAAKKAEETE